ncbi:MFS transporter [Oceanithermus sp.]|uniref:MFS transporter n=1 Tax=Oceanithermus sp. TaxID=2268145 RepID=UPI00257B55FC|nr:MFS transporter [Oceanithermus sp.]
MSGGLRVFVLFTFAYFLSYFFRSANAVIAPDLTRELGLDAATLGLMTSLFYLAFAAVQLPLGGALDRWGPRWVTPALMLVGAAGSWVFAAAHTVEGLMLGRLLLGVGMAGILMGAYKAFSRWFPAGRFATVAGWLVGIGSAGALASGTPLAWLAEVLGWRNVFFWGGWVIALSALAITLGVRNTPQGDRLEPGPRTGGLLAVFASPVFWSMAGMNLFVVGAFLGIQTLWAGPYLYQVHGMDPITVGNMLFVLSFGALVGFLSTGWIADRVGVPPTILALGTGFVTLVGVLAWWAEGLGPLALGVLLFALGYTGTVGVILLAYARLAFPTWLTGRATTAVNLFGIGGTFLVQWGMGAVIQRFPRTDGAYPPEAFSAAFGTAAVLGALALGAFALGRRFDRKEEKR